VRRVTVAAAVVALAVACGGVDEERPESRNVLQGPARAKSGEASSVLVELDDGVHAIALMTSFERVDCFDGMFQHSNDPDSMVTFGGAGCIEDRAWHVDMGTGGEPNSVDWTVIVGVLRPEVAQVTITSESGAVHRPATRPARTGDWRVFSQRLDEGVRRLEAHGTSGALLESVSVPHQLLGTCGWVCEAQGPWSRTLHPWLGPRGLKPLESDPNEAVVEDDARLQRLFAGTRLDLWAPQGWTECAGIERGATWFLSTDGRRAPDGGEWPTLNVDGEPITLTATEPPAEIVVDIDVARRKVVSILPYYVSGPLEWSGKISARAPLAGNVCREVP
jgi:hypothetical protein